CARYCTSSTCFHFDYW
nr:immunoglobulin heavy chain junction region [Macaca mulatta]